MAYAKITARPENRRSIFVKHVAVISTPPKKTKSARRGAKHSGWPETCYLDHAEFKQAKSNAHMICNAGYRWSIFVSLVPPDHLPDADKLRWIRRKLGRLGQALERRGQPYISQTTLEKKRGGKLHGHALIFVLKENFDMIERHADKFERVASKKLGGEISVEFHAEVIGATPDDLRNVILYSLKQHLFAGEFEKARKFWIAKGDPIKGSRLSYSKTALAILAKEKAKLPGAADNAPRDAAAVPMAHSFGMKQPHFNNVKHGRDKFGPWAHRRALEFLRLAA
jgi:hypothetical protein